LACKKGEKARDRPSRASKWSIIHGICIYSATKVVKWKGVGKFYVRNTNEKEKQHFLSSVSFHLFRRMFPTVRCSFSGIDLTKNYVVLLDIIPCDNKRYRYAYHRSSWLVAGKADPPPPYRFYPHPDSPFSGEQLLRRQVVSFEKVKLTNNELDKTGQVIRKPSHCPDHNLFMPTFYSWL
jgi:hypothetical protein